jgi:capsule biosynthesis phosphatase
MNKKKRIVIDLDGTISQTKSKCEHYSQVKPNYDIINKLKQYKDEGFYIIISTSRNMNSFNDNLGKINKNTAPIIYAWLEKYQVSYDEIYFGKPWCGFDGFYVDDKAIRPDEFLKLTTEEIKKITK